MRIIIIILFFIILFLTMIIKIDIEKIEVLNQKVFFRAKLKVYIFKYIKIFQKTIKKEELYKFFFFSEKHKLIKKERKFLKKIYPKVETFNLDLDYGIKNIFLNVYIYGIINMIIPCLIAKFDINSKNIEYNIKSNFKTNYIKIKFKSRVEISILNNIIKNVKAAIH